MKFLNFLLIVSIFLLGSCKKDSTTTTACEPPVLSKNIVGAWSAKASFGPISETGKVTFNADGTVVDPEGFLVDVSLNGVTLTDKTWSASADEKIITVKAAKQGVGSSSILLELKSQTCQSIDLKLDGLADLTLTK